MSSRLAEVGLERYADSQVDTLSRGTVQRLAVARALLHDPDIVLLDEPYTGLDAYAGALLQELLAALKDGGRTVVMVTHNWGGGSSWPIAWRSRCAAASSSKPSGPIWMPSALERSYRRAVEGRG